MQSISRKAALALSVVALLSLPIGMIAARAHVHTYKTNVSIHYDKHDDRIWGHLGTASFCQDGRTVELFRDGASVGATTSGRGFYSFPASGDGSYQAVVAESPGTGYTSEHTCLRGSSKTISVP